MTIDKVDKKLMEMAFGSKENHSPSLYDMKIEKIPWERAMKLPLGYGYAWRSTFMGLAVESRHDHPTPLINRVVKGLFEKLYPQYTFDPEKLAPAIFMVAGLLEKNSDKEKGEEISKERIIRWVEFQYDRYNITNNRDRSRFEMMGVLPGEPDPEPDEEIAMAKKATKKKVVKKKATKKTATKKATKKVSKKVTKKVSKKVVKKKATKKTATKKATVEKTLEGVPQEYVSLSSDGEVYDKRRGRPGSYRHIICSKIDCEAGATRDTCVNAAIKAGLYKDTEAGKKAAAYQFGMHINAMKREEERGVEVEKLDDKTNRWCVTFSED